MKEKDLKLYRIFGCVAIAFCVTSCSTSAKLENTQPINKVHAAPVPDQPVTSPTDAKPQPSTNLENLNFEVPAKFQGKTLYKVEPSNQEKVIALTVDDGPWPKTTLQMLDIFKANNVKVTFFWVGSALQANPEIAKRVVAEGHAIGNHTWHHWYKNMDAATAKKEIDRTSDLIYKTTGVKTTLFRPPGGFLNNGLAAYAKSQKYSVVMWSLTSADTDPRAKPQAFVKNVLKGAKPGAIVLMHDGGGDRHRTLEALPQIITGLKQQGYRFVTIPELLQESEK
ncbi:polysaccharide deacetylase family protein [Nostoc spongiaeforme]|uniref:polysaccharide deacetylase family protein n=1 Tax=Nostoc spongiaeforme TaxID=502487 RepID=UPI0028BD7B23|nr:polysaccharide deacetylase family protein [Nostoc spongiaeforme]